MSTGYHRFRPLAHRIARAPKPGVVSSSLAAPTVAGPRNGWSRPRRDPPFSARTRPAVAQMVANPPGSAPQSSEPLDAGARGVGAGSSLQDSRYPAGSRCLGTPDRIEL